MPPIDRFTAWLRAYRVQSDLVAEEALLTNLRRLRWLLPVIMLLNAVCVIVFWGGPGDDASPERAWKNLIGWTHLCMAIWLLAPTLAIHWLVSRNRAGRSAQALQLVVSLSLLLFAVAFSVIDQRVMSTISPFLLGCAFVGMLLLRPAAAAALFGVGYACFFFGMGLAQQDPSQLLSNRIAGLFAATMGLALALVLWRNNTGYVLLQRELRDRNTALLLQQEELVWLAKRDALTGLFNRGEFLRLAEAELLRAQRHGTDTSAIMVDMDYFKNINDVYGHPAGDSALKHAAACLLGGVRATDVVARVGGEEFMVLLPHTSGDAAVTLAEKLLHALRKSPARIGAELEVAVTASFGVGTLPAIHKGTVAWLYAASDYALYEAKRLGRNRVERAKPDPSMSASDFLRMRRR